MQLSVIMHDALDICLLTGITATSVRLADRGHFGLATYGLLAFAYAGRRIKLELKYSIPAHLRCKPFSQLSNATLKPLFFFLLARAARFGASFTQFSLYKSTVIIPVCFPENMHYALLMRIEIPVMESSQIFLKDVLSLP